MSLDEAARREAEMEELRASLAAARARADEADRKARDAHEDLLGARRRAAAAEILRADLNRARDEVADLRHRLKVAQELAPESAEADTPQIIEELRVAYAAKEAELTAERDALGAEVATLRERLGETEASFEERAGWACMTQSELDDIAEAVGLPKDCEHGRVRGVVAELVAQCKALEAALARAREAEAAATARLDEARHGDGDMPGTLVRARSKALGEVAAALGMRRNAPVDDIVAAVAALLEDSQQIARVAAVDGGLAARDNGAPDVERLLVALWPGRADEDALPIPAAESIDEAVQRIEELRELADEWANGRPAAPASDLLQRLFDALLGQVEAGTATPDVLDRLERMATGG